MSSSRQLAVIVFSDIAGYTALMGKDETKAYEILRTNREIHKKTVSKFNGRLVKEMGDGMLLSFGTVTDALHAAIEIQDLCKASGLYALRIGMHLGEVLLDEGDVFGDPVNLASRIHSLGVPGSILVSKRINDEIENKSNFKTASMGFFDFKNVAKTMEIFALVNPGLPQPKRHHLKGKTQEKKRYYLWMAWLIGAAIITWAVYNLSSHKSGFQTPESEMAIDPTVAVLAFADMSPLQDHEWFSDGLSEEILNELAQIPELKVTARTSSFYFKDKNVTITEIGEQLGVNYVVEGSVRRSDDGLRVTAQLIRANDGFHIWSQNFERSSSDLYAVQDSIAHNIAQALISRVTIVRPKPDRPSNLQAYDYFLRGLHLHFDEYALSGNPEVFLQAEQMFLEAIHLAPDYASAYGGLAGLYQSVAPYLRHKIKLPYPKDIYESKSDSLLQIGQKLNPTSISVLRGLGLRWQDKGQMDSAFTTFIQLLKYYPGMDVTYSSMSTFYKRLGMYDQATLFAEKAIALDPLNLGLMVDLAELKYVTDFKEYERLIDKCYKLDPTLEKVQWLMLQKKMINIDTTGLAGMNDFSDKMLHLMSLSLRQEKTAALEIINRIKQFKQPEPVGTIVLYRFLNMKNEALNELEQWAQSADKPKESFLNYLISLAPNHKTFDFIAKEPRFKKLVKDEQAKYKTRLEQYTAYQNIPDAFLQNNLTPPVR